MQGLHLHQTHKPTIFCYIFRMACLPNISAWMLCNDCMIYKFESSFESVLLHFDFDVPYRQPQLTLSNVIVTSRIANILQLAYRILLCELDKFYSLLALVEGLLSLCGDSGRRAEFGRGRIVAGGLACEVSDRFRSLRLVAEFGASTAR